MITLNLLIISLCAVRLISAVSIFQLAGNNTEINELNRHRHLIDTSLRKVSVSPIFLNEMTAQQESDSYESNFQKIKGLKQRLQSNWRKYHHTLLEIAD